MVELPVFANVTATLEPTDKCLWRGRRSMSRSPAARAGARPLLDPQDHGVGQVLGGHRGEIRHDVVELELPP